MRNSKFKKFFAMILGMSLVFSTITSISAADMEDGGELVAQRIKAIEGTMPTVAELKKESEANIQYQIF